MPDTILFLLVLHNVWTFSRFFQPPATSHLGILGVMDAGGSTLQQLSDSCWMALATRLRGALENEYPRKIGLMKTPTKKYPEYYIC